MTDHYELLYIIGANIAEDKLDTICEKIKKLLTDQGAQITLEEKWQRRRLAYPIAHQYYGYYFVLEFDVEKSKVKSISEKLRLTNEVLRFQIIKKKKKSAEELQKEKELKARRAQKLAQELKDREEQETTRREPAREPSKAPEKPPVQEKILKKKPDEKPKVSMEDLDKKLDEILDTKDIL